MTTMEQADSEEVETEALGALGRRIRGLRAGRGLTLAELAAQARLSVAMLSHIERGQASPSLRSLERLRIALGVPLATFFEAPEPADEGNGLSVIRGARRPRLEFPDRGLIKQLLSPADRAELEVLLLEIEVGGGSGGEPWTRNAVKAGLVLEGGFELTVGSEVASLAAGDSFQFDASVPHRFRNVGSEVARVVWIIMPADPA